MNLQQLTYFVRVAELEHYTRAAEELHITQPCISHAIHELEHELGVPLFYKSGRNIRLTRFGMDFYKHIQVALKEIEEATEEIREHSGVKEGRIYLAHISSMYEQYIPFLMTNFYRDPSNSNIKLEMHEAPTGQLIRELKERKLDVGFGGYMEDPELRFDRIYTERLVLIVGLDHPLAARESVTLAETAQYDYIEYDPICSIRSVTDGMFARTGVQRNIVGEYFDNNMIAGLVSHGTAIAIVPETYGSGRGTLKKISLANEDTYRDLYMISLAKEYRTPLVKKFMNFVNSLASE